MLRINAFTPQKYAVFVAIALAFAVVAGPAWAPPNFETVEVDCADACIDSFEIEESGVDTSDLADAAVTLSKFAFDPLPLQRVVYVSGDGPAIANGTALLDAIDAIGSSGACAVAPSADNPCLVKLGPGVYDIGAESLFMTDHTDMEGSGEGLTTLTGTGAPGSPALLFGANAELRNLTVENTKAGEQVLPVRAIITGDGNARISHVTAIANGNDNATRNVAIGIFGAAGSPVLTHVTARTEPSSFTIARAIEVGDGSTPQMFEVSAISASQALVLVGEDSETVTVRNSRLIGGAWSILAFQVGGSVKLVDVHGSKLEGTVLVQPSGTVNLGASQLNGAVEAGGGIVNCLLVVDGNLQPHSC